jgi:hypothetical protein
MVGLVVVLKNFAGVETVLQVHVEKVSDRWTKSNGGLERFRQGGNGWLESVSEGRSAVTVVERERSGLQQSLIE